MTDVPKSKSKEKKSTKSVDKKKKASSKNLKSKEKPTISTLEDNPGEIGEKNPTTTENQRDDTYQNPINYYEQLSLNKPQLIQNNNLLHNNMQYDQKEKCEGCYEGDGVVYCTNCGKIYCKICEDQIHVVPSNRLHERRPLNDVTHLRKLCYHHNNPLKYFCESCEEPICQECQMIGPHNNKLHKIISIFESFKKKYAYLSTLITKNIMQKYEQTMSQISYLNYISEQIKKVKNGIEREIRGEYAELIDELNSIEGKKLAVLNYESSILQKDINKMQEVITYVNELGGSESPDMISFLLRYKQLNEKIEYSLAKPIKSKVDITIDDFPRRVEENKKKMDKIMKYEKLLKIKDDLIWKIINDKKESSPLLMSNHNNLFKDHEKEIQEIKEKSKNEIEEWAKLSDKYAMELQKYNLVCCFCGCYLDEITVNSSCEKNNEPNQVETLGYSKCPPPEEVKGTGRHYFLPPLKENDELYGRKSNHSNPFDKNIYNETNYISNKSMNNNPNHEWMIEFIHEIFKQKEGFITSLQVNDKDIDGFINLNEFCETLKTLGYNLSQYEIDYLLTGLAMGNKDKLGINELIKNMENILVD